uniref:CCR4-NOT transcription complex subunit 10 n=1 Tax=Lotharella oceanica TaxID=641309 RepID=A0A7S2TVE8_9EUKA
MAAAEGPSTRKLAVSKPSKLPTDGIRYIVQNSTGDDNSWTANQNTDAKHKHSEMLSEASLSLRNALIILEQRLANTNGQASSALAQTRTFMVEVLLMLMYTSLGTHDPHMTLAYGRKVLEVEGFREGPPSHRFLAHTYMAEALCDLNKPKEAANHLKSPYLQTNEALAIPPADQHTRSAYRISTMKNSSSSQEADAKHKDWVCASKAALFVNLATCFVLRDSLQQVYASSPLPRDIAFLYKVALDPSGSAVRQSGVGSCCRLRSCTEAGHIHLRTSWRYSRCPGYLEKAAPCSCCSATICLVRAKHRRESAAELRACNDDCTCSSVGLVHKFSSYCSSM